MKIADLLGVTLKNAKPNAYELVGLEIGENDPEKIRVAIHAVMDRLRSNKLRSDPKLWATAAKGVSQAKSLLTDPQRKLEYDSKLGLVPAGVGAAAPYWSQELSSFFPEDSPELPFDVLQYSRWAAEHEWESTFASFPEDESLEAEPWGQSEPAAQEVWRDEPTTEPVQSSLVNVPKRRRRRGLPVLPALVGLVAIGLLGGVGYLAYRLANQQPLVVAKNGSDPNGAPQPTGVAATAAPVEVFDPVMGRMPAAASRPAEPLPEASLIAQSQTPEPPPGPTMDTPVQTPMMAEDPAMNSEPSAVPTMPLMSEPPVPTTVPNPPMAASMAPAEPVPPEGTQPPPSAPSPADLQKGEQAVKMLMNVVREQRWKTPEAAFTAAAQQAVAEIHQQQVEQIQRLVEYAKEYDDAIHAGSGKLNAGEDFELTPGNRIAVVEVRSDLIIIRAPGRNKEISLIDPPLVLAHAMVRFALDVNHATTQAFRAAYLSLAKMSNDTDRREAITLFESLAADPAAKDEVNVEGLAEIVRQLMMK